MTLSVEYELGMQDVASLRRAVSAKTGGGKRQSWVILLFFGILLALWICSAAIKGTLIGLLQVVVPAIIVIALIGFFVWRGLRTATAEQVKRLSARHRVEISDAGVVQSGEYGSSTFPWKAVVDIRHDDSHMFMFNGPNSAVVIPARAFSTMTGFREFVALAEKYRKVCLQQNMTAV